MDVFGDRKFVEIPGERQHELPPLLIHSSTGVKRLDRVMEMAEQIVQSEDLLEVDGTNEQLFERRKMDLAINLVEQYLAFLSHWHWGNGIVEWIRQCETTFQIDTDLRRVLRPDVWPHASRSSFVTLLNDKHVETDGVNLERAVGMRLTFRQPPPIACFSNQFLFYLNGTVASSAFHTWSDLAPSPISSLPPERFHFQVVGM